MSQTTYTGVLRVPEIVGAPHEEPGRSSLAVRIVEEGPAEVETSLLAVQLFQGERELDGPAREIDARLGGAITRVLERGDFKGNAGETLFLFPRAGELGAERVLLVGAGKQEEHTLESVRRAVGTVVRNAERLGVQRIALTLGHLWRLADPPRPYDAARAAMEGVVLAGWSFTELKSRGESEEAPRGMEEVLLVAGRADQAEEIRRGAAEGEIVARAENLARELGAWPGNFATPTYLAEVAVRIAGEHGLDVTVLDREALEREGMNTLLAVSRGSEEPPCLIVLEYRGADPGEAPLALVGKGVTFDSGGISLKRGGMSDMKYDLAGGAAVLGAMQAIAGLRLPVNVVGLVPATENLPSGRALKPGDVIRSHSGKTIEVLDTDGEGRLILADAMSYARRYRPSAMLDAATLGGCIGALGHHAIGIMGNDEALLEQVRTAGERTGQRCWPLPMWREYRAQLNSAVADLPNTAGFPAQPITAAWFLREFVDDTPWVHMDIAGVAWRDGAAPYLRNGATGSPTRLLVEWVRARALG
jgi:leucyl aminopeptidase